MNMVFLLLLLLYHGIKAADSVVLKPVHRAATVKDKNDLSQILSHVHYLHQKM